MRVELHVNGSHQMILIPETKIEKAMLEEMVDSAGKGRAVRLTPGDVLDSCIVSVGV